MSRENTKDIEILKEETKELEREILKLKNKFPYKNEDDQIMKELIRFQPSKRILSMLHKMKERVGGIESNCVDDEISYEIFQKGTYTCCILTINNEIVGIGMTKRYRKDKYSTRVALDVCTHKAIKDYLFGIKPEHEHSEK